MHSLKSIETHVVYRYIDTLKSNELKSCLEFLGSKWNYKQNANPYFNISKTKALFKFLVKKKTSYEAYLLQKEGLSVKPLKIYEYQAFNKVFNTKYKAQNISKAERLKLNNEKTVLKKMIEQFLVINHTLSDNKRVDYMNLLMETMYHRLTGKRSELEYFGTRNFKLFETDCQQASSSCSESKLNMRKLLTNRHFYEIVIDNEGKFAPPLLGAMEEEFLINLVQTLCTTTAGTYVFKTENNALSEFDYLEDLIDKARDSKEIQMYYQVLMLLANKGNKEDTYFDCFSYYINNQFYAQDARSIFGFLLVYLNHHISLGQSIYESARILLIKHVLNTKVVSYDSALFARLFQMIVRIGMQEEINVDWVNQYILERQKLLEKLLPAERYKRLESIVDAHSFFAEEKFYSTHLFLERIDRDENITKDSNEYFDVQILKIKTNYELSEPLGHQPFLGRLEFLKSDRSKRNNRRSETSLQAHINFCRTTNRLFTQKSRGEYSLKKNTLIQIYQDIIENPIEERTWLLEKLYELAVRTGSNHNIFCFEESCMALHN